MDADTLERPVTAPVRVGSVVLPEESKAEELPPEATPLEPGETISVPDETPWYSKRWLLVTTASVAALLVTSIIVVGVVKGHTSSERPRNTPTSLSAKPAAMESKPAEPLVVTIPERGQTSASKTQTVTPLPTPPPAPPKAAQVEVPQISSNARELLALKPGALEADGVKKAIPAPLPAPATRTAPEPTSAPSPSPAPSPAAVKQDPIEATSHLYVAPMSSRETVQVVNLIIDLGAQLRDMRTTQAQILKTQAMLIEHQIPNLEQRIGLAEARNTLRDAAAAGVNASTKPTTEAPAPFPSISAKNYVMRAASPGIAILATDNGAIRTVSTGDEVPGLGKIQSIAMRGSIWVVSAELGEVKQSE